MTKEELQTRIDKKQIDIEKINKRIVKWSTNMNPKAIEICKKFGDFAYGTPEYKVAWQEYSDFKKDHSYDADVNNPNDWNKGPNLGELYSAYRDLYDNNLTLTKYKNALEVQDEKSQRPIIKVFKDFFDNWKKEILTWVRSRYSDYLKERQEYREWQNSKSFEERRTPEYEEESNKRWKHLRSILESSGWLKMYEDKIYMGNDDDFVKYLDQYMEDRYFELVNKVTKFTGTINDVTGLRFGSDGSLNGIVIGDEGKAKIETIIAGGYNIQCAHYRVLVHKVN